MNVITEHYAFGEDGLIVAVGISIRTSKSLFDTYHEEFHAIVRMTVDEAREAIRALRSPHYSEFEKALDDGSYIDIVSERPEDSWIEWHDSDGRSLCESFVFGRDGWSEPFAEAIKRGIKEALL